MDNWKKLKKNRYIYVYEYIYVFVSLFAMHLKLTMLLINYTPVWNKKFKK